MVLAADVRRFGDGQIDYFEGWVCWMSCILRLGNIYLACRYCCGIVEEWMWVMRAAMLCAVMHRRMRRLRQSIVGF